jgi:hypothetical protein
MLRHKALIQAVRVAFGFSGIHDEDEALDIVEAAPKAPRNVTPKQPLFKAPAPALQAQDAPQEQPQGDEQPPVEADNAGLNSPDPIRRADLQAVEDVKEANYAKIATELDAKRKKIEDAFLAAGLNFDNLVAFLASRGQDVAETSFGELPEPVVNRLIRALDSFVTQAKKLKEGGAL